MRQTLENNKKIFDSEGKVSFGGWSRDALFEYNKENYPSPGKLCERDCYYISTEEMGFYLSVSTVGTELSIKLALADFRTCEVNGDAVIKRFWLEPKALPRSGSNGEFTYTDKKIALTLTNTVDGRYIKCDFIDFAGVKNLYMKLIVKKRAGDSMNIVAPFDGNPHCFYLKRFAPKFVATGVVRFGGTNYNLDEKNSLVYFDWSRFALPRRQKRQLLSSIDVLGDHRFSLNLSSRVGNTRRGSENCYFIDNTLCKLGRIKVEGAEKDPLGRWYFTCTDGTAELCFTPEEKNGTTMSCKCDKTVIIFGSLSGRLKNNGVTFDIKDIRAHMIFDTI